MVMVMVMVMAIGLDDVCIDASLLMNVLYLNRIMD